MNQEFGSSICQSQKVWNWSDFAGRGAWPMAVVRWSWPLPITSSSDYVSSVSWESGLECLCLRPWAPFARASFGSSGWWSYGSCAVRPRQSIFSVRRSWAHAPGTSSCSSCSSYSPWSTPPRSHWPSPRATLSASWSSEMVSGVAWPCPHHSRCSGYWACPPITASRPRAQPAAATQSQDVSLCGPRSSPPPSWCSVCYSSSSCHSSSTAIFWPWRPYQWTCWLRWPDGAELEEQQHYWSDCGLRLEGRADSSGSRLRLAPRSRAARDSWTISADYLYVLSRHGGLEFDSVLERLRCAWRCLGPSCTRSS